LDKILTIKILDVRAGDRDFSPALEPAGLVTSGGILVTVVTPVTSGGLVIIILTILATDLLIKALIIKVTQMGLEIAHHQDHEKLRPDHLVRELHQVSVELRGDEIFCTVMNLPVNKKCSDCPINCFISDVS